MIFSRSGSRHSALGVAGTFSHFYPRQASRHRRLHSYDNYLSFEIDRNASRDSVGTLDAVSRMREFEIAGRRLKGCSVRGSFKVSPRARDLLNLSAKLRKVWKNAVEAAAINHLAVLFNYVRGAAS